MSHLSIRRHSSTMEPEERYIKTLREMDTTGELKEEIDRVEMEVRKKKMAPVTKGLRRRYKASKTSKLGK